MTRKTLAAVSALVIAGGVLSWCIHQHAAAQRRETSASSLELAGQLARLQEECSQLSNKIAQRKPAASLPDHEFLELLRLRSEVGRLRGERRETHQLHATNQQLLATLARTDRAQTVPVRWTREQLAFAGYADPESTMISTLWALSLGEPEFFRLTPDQKALLAKEGETAEFAAQTRKIGELLYPSSATGISLIGKQLNSPDEAVVDLYYEGEGKTRKFLLRRMAGEWKLLDLVSITAN